MSTNFYIINYNNFWKIHRFNFFLYKSTGDQIWLCRKIGQGQPRVNIRRNLLLKHPMLHTKFHSHRPLGSREDFVRFLPYGHGGHLGHVTRTVWTNFRSPIPRRLHMTFTGPVVSLEKMFKERGRRTDSRRRPSYPISSSMSLRLRWAKNRKIWTCGFTI